MAFNEQELDIAKRVKEQWWTQEDFLEIIKEFRKRQPKQQVWPQNISTPEIPTEQVSPVLEGQQDWPILRSIKDIWEAPTTLAKWVIATWKWLYEWAKDITTWALSLSDKLTDKAALSISNKIRWLMWKQELSQEEFKQKFPTPEQYDQKVQEDLLQIWQGSLQTWFTTLFPLVTTAINTVWQVPLWEKVLEVLSTAIWKWWEFVNKIPLLKQFRESLPEEKKAEFDEFTWQVATLWITKWVSEWIWKIKQSRIRPTEEVGANILKPTARTPLDLESGTKWLQQLQETKPFKPKSFKEVIDNISKKQQTDFPALKKWLTDAQKKIALIKDTSVSQAIDWLETILKNQPWKKFTEIRNRVKELKTKLDSKWLTLNELQEVKSLHTQQNSLFSELWKETGWFSKEWLRAVRSDIKTLIEDRALEWGFKNVKEINTKFWELENAKQFVKLQDSSLQSYLWRQGKQSLLQDVVNFALELPWIKQWFTAPLQTAFGKLSRSLREWKVNPIEVQKQLPALFKELKQAWVKEWTINEIKSNIAIKLGWIDIIWWKLQQSWKKNALDFLFNK